MKNTKELRSILDRVKGQKDKLSQDINSFNSELKKSKRKLRAIEKGRTILQVVAKETQNELQFHISNPVSMAQDAIFDNPYELDLQFVSKRGKSEAELNFLRDDELTDPLNATGGGAVNVAALALRIAVKTLTEPKTRNLLLLDEPFRDLSKDLHEKAGLMLEEFSKQLKVQIIMVTHSKELGAIAESTVKLS